MKCIKRCLLSLLVLSSYFSLAQNIEFYGMTYGGGIYGFGNIFKFSPTPSSYVNKINFEGYSGPGAAQSPLYGHMIKASDGNLYGMTEYGGTSQLGNIFKYNPITNTYTNLVNFTGTVGAYPGYYPYGSLVQASDGNLYGMTVNGGVNGLGNIFKYNISTSTFTDLVDFTGTTGAYLGQNPWGNLIQAYDGNLYGMTSNGGSLGEGNIFKYNPTTSTFTNLINFINGISNFGRNPTGSLIQASDSNLYGMTDQGGPSYIGSIFKYNIGTSTFTNLVNFTGATGAYLGYAPKGSLIQAYDGNLYGMTSNGAANNYGNIFKYNPTSSVFTDLVDFTDQTGIYPGGTPYGSLIQASDSNLYGMTQQGGANNYGDIFKYKITTSTYSDLIDFTGTIGSYIGESPYGDLLEIDTAIILGIGKNMAEPIINIYPVPNNGIFNVEISNYEVAATNILEIYNMLGEKIYSTKLKATNTQISLSNKISGLYLYRVLTETGSLVSSGKFIIQ